MCRGFPSEFAAYLHYTRSLRFDDRPDYAYLRKLFRELFVREGYTYDYVFDWNVLGYDTDTYFDNKNKDEADKNKSDDGPNEESDKDKDKEKEKKPRDSEIRKS